MRYCVAMLGPGRSGTSLAMKLLAEVGLRLSGDLLPASPDNPDGHFEDVGIVDAQQLLLRSLHLSPYLPLPDDWTDSPAYGIARRRIATIVADEVTRDPRPWGFKDPRTCALWPLWQDVLATANVESRVVFCVRRGEDVVRSMVNAYDLSQDAAEGIYVYRTFHALDDVSEGWFFVKYADWFTTAEQQLRSLAEHCGLGNDTANHGSIVSGGFRPELDRESRGPELHLSGVVVEIDRLFDSFSGTAYDQGAIDDWCRSVEERIADFRFVYAGIDRFRTAPRPLSGARVWRAVQHRLERLKPGLATRGGGRRQGG